MKTAVAERDTFARSAYNRYYFGCFLLLRSELIRINPDWEKLSHKSYPGVLNGKVRKLLSNGAKQARRLGDHKLAGQIDQVKRTLPQIADLMTTANAVRIVADYNPEIPVEFKDSKRFSLYDVDITIAHNWEQNIRLLTGSLRSVWNQIDA